MRALEHQLRAALGVLVVARRQLLVREDQDALVALLELVLDPVDTGRGRRRGRGAQQAGGQRQASDPTPGGNSHRRNANAQGFPCPTRRPRARIDL